MMRLTENAQVLTISYPGWLGLLAFALGVALAIWVGRHFVFNARFFGLGAAALIALYGGLYFFTCKAELTPEEGRSYALLKGGHTRISWAQASSAALVERAGKGRPHYIVVDQTGGPPFEINVTDLPSNDRNRVLHYIYARLQRVSLPQH